MARIKFGDTHNRNNVSIVKVLNEVMDAVIF